MVRHDLIRPRWPLAVALAAVLAAESAAPARAATRAENLLHRRTDALADLFAKLELRAVSLHSVRHGTRRPEGGVVIPVTSCADDGSPDTLRHAVLIASSGDTVDLNALMCSTITLASGAIDIHVDDLTIEGPGASRLTIDAAHASRVFRHDGAGTLQITDLTVANGSYSASTAPYGGGCLYSVGTLSMTRAVATGCAASANGAIAGGAVFGFGDVMLYGSAITESSATSIVGYSSVAAAGGGIFAIGEVVLEHSVISGNSVTAPTGSVYGGGVLGQGRVSVKYSTIDDNGATTGGGAAAYAIGGGIATDSGAFVRNSTFHGNIADAGGAMDLRQHSYTSTLINATISGNHARILGGGMLVDTDLNVESCTIAFNDSGPAGGGGLIANGTNANLRSSIIADNAPSGATAAADLDGSASVTGANSLIEVSGVAVPPDTIMLDPQLGPLAANGGETRTHALPATSPAIDTGNNDSGSSFDQRGPGFPRVVGGTADIGAYELDFDTIFADGFDAGDGSITLHAARVDSETAKTPSPEVRISRGNTGDFAIRSQP